MKFKPGWSLILELTLYAHPLSLHSQKVKLALLEKSIPFNEVYINIGPKMENYEYRYAKLNPHMEVPCLDASGEVIDGSKKILEYLGNMELGEHLLSISPQENVISQMWLEKQDRLPMRELSYGLMPAYKKKLFLKMFPQRFAKLEELLEEHEDITKAVETKIADIELWYKSLQEDHDPKASLTKVQYFLEELEDYLRHRPYMGGEKFGLADAPITVILTRLEFLGVLRKFDVSPESKIRSYLERQKKRSTYKEAIPYSHLTPWSMIRYFLFPPKKQKKIGSG